jgi:hypothetical protein
MNIKRVAKLLFFKLFLVLAVPAYAGTSDQLPVELVERLVSSGVWHDQLDEDNESSQRLISFWQGLQSKEVSDELTHNLSDLMFDFQDDYIVTAPSGEKKNLPSTNPMLVIVLRYAKEKSPESFNMISQIEQMWKKRYIDLVFDLVKMTSEQEVINIFLRFRDKIGQGEIEVCDLSPTKRQELSREIRQVYGVGILDKVQGSDRYKVTGLYNPSKRIFCVDFGRNIDETLITFIHEMVHAADPLQDIHLRKYKELFEPTLEILTRWSGDPNVAELIERDIMQSTFFEEDIEFLQQVLDDRDLRMRVLEEEFESIEEITPEDERVVREWIKAAIGLTIENEYRAYGFSMLVYAALREHLNFIVYDSIQYERFLHRFISGDRIFALDLSVNQDPFRGAKTAIFIAGHRPQMADSLESTLNRLEYYYLAELKDLLANQLNQKFSDAIQMYTDGQNDIDSILPRWARPGGFELPSNPHSILTARITTLAVSRLKNTLVHIYDYLAQANEPLLLQKLGILDLHDVTAQDLKLLGIHYRGETRFNQRSLPNGVSLPIEEELKHLNKNTDAYLRAEEEFLTQFEHLFEMYQYPFSVEFEDDENEKKIVRGENVAGNLIKLRLLKTLNWLKKTVTVWYPTIQTSNNYINKIRTGDYQLENEDIDPERARELERELLSGLDVADRSAEELTKLRLLHNELYILNAIATEGDWASILQEFRNEIHTIKSILESLNVRSDRSALSNSEQIRVALEGFKNQDSFENLKRRCGRQTRRDTKYWFGLDEDRFTLTNGNYSSTFPLMVICSNRKIYAVRQPGDYTGFMTTRTMESRRGESTPYSKIFFDSREIKLRPLSIYEK